MLDGVASGGGADPSPGPGGGDPAVQAMATRAMTAPNIPTLMGRCVRVDIRLSRPPKSPR